MSPNSRHDECANFIKSDNRRTLFESNCEQSATDVRVAPLSERQQLAIALRLSSDDSKCTNRGNDYLLRSYLRLPLIKYEFICYRLLQHI